MPPIKSIHTFACAALISVLGLGSASAIAQSARPFVDSEFDVPETLETAQYRLRMLSVGDVVKDFDAVISSEAQLRTVFPDSTWPDGLTLEQNLIDLGWHQKEFQRRRSFAYTVISLDESRVVGCVYINPTTKRGYDAEVYLWARESALGSTADAELFDVVSAWLEEEWPFEKAAFPGRTIDWDAWESVPDAKR